MSEQLDLLVLDSGQLRNTSNCSPYPSVETMFEGLNSLHERLVGWLARTILRFEIVSEPFWPPHRGSALIGPRISSRDRASLVRVYSSSSPTIVLSLLFWRSVVASMLIHGWTFDLCPIIFSLQWCSHSQGSPTMIIYFELWLFYL